MEIIELLIAKDPDLPTKSAGNWTPLHQAIQCGHVKVVNFLLEDLKQEIPLVGWTPLHEAAFRGHVEIGKLLYAKNSALLSCEYKTEDPLAVAQKQSHCEFVAWIKSLSSVHDKK